jgi:signal transduction histidine kinase
VNLRGAPPLKLSLPLDGKGITVKAAREKHSILVNDLRGSEDYFRGSMESMSELAVPVVLDGKTVAVLNVESMELDDFTEDDRKLLETLTYHVAFALNRERDDNGGVTGEAVKAMRLDYALGRLEDAEKVSSLVRGQLRDSLRSIKNASGILMDKPEMLPDLVSSIDREADHASKVAEIITETLEASGRDEIYVELNQIVKTVMGFIYIPRSVETKVSYQSGLLVSEMRRDKITRVVENLVRNAVEAMPDGGTLEVNISQRQRNAIIEVRDQGGGIPLEAKDRLFEPFNSTKQGHAGLGLAFCKRTLESLGGSIEAVVDETGTTMAITVPLRNF